MLPRRSACRDLGAALVAFSPLARGLLAGSVRDDRYAEGDIRKARPRFVEPQLGRNLELARAFEAIAHGEGITPAQLSLAWVLAQGDDLVAIPGTRSIAHLRENVAWLDRGVSADAIAAVTRLFPPNALHGPRYGAAAQSQIDTEMLAGEPMA